MLLCKLSLLGLLAMVTAGNSENRLLIDSSSKNRTARSLPCPPNEYLHDGLCCTNCPAGTHVSEHCTVNHRPGHCAPCATGQDFTAEPNGLEECLKCHPCRYNDQVQIAECIGSRDYQCQCKPNTFCTNSCLYCKDCSRCPEGQQVKHECTPTLDTVCEDISTVPPTTAKTTDAENQGLFIGLLVLSICIALACFAFIWWKKKKDKKKQTGDGNTIYKTALVEDPLEIVRIEPVMSQPAPDQVENVGVQDTCPPLGEQDNEKFYNVGTMAHLHEDAASCHLLTVYHSTENYVPSSVVFTNGCDKKESKSDQTLTNEEWLECYNCLVEHISPNRWKEMMRNLGLSEVQMEHIQLDHNGLREINYQMFHLWRNQNSQGASMNKVLHVLDKMNLHGCKENVANALAFKGILVA
ncbi:tumor necrosis factor receptor superfamily member 1A-like isoform X2 [Pyxicephalus adspersus]|uniref:tumor necrosis factor receptor superfamily member 1A-like isoform X2 n=1 Tax=Pyxicephalus adspersus TaxID=30357 RepID=UPI003B58C9A4